MGWHSEGATLNLGHLYGNPTNRELVNHDEDQGQQCPAIRGSDPTVTMDANIATLRITGI